MAYEIIMPALGMNQDTGIIVSWHKQLQESVRAGDTLFEVETDKATLEVEAGHDGILAWVTERIGEPIRLGDVIAIIATTREEAAAIFARAQ